jgi:hypothetical protein
MAVHNLMVYVPLYLQLRRCSTSQTDLRLLPEPIGGGMDPWDRSWRASSCAYQASTVF